MFNFRDLISGATDDLTPNYKKTTPSDDFAHELMHGSDGQTVKSSNPVIGALGGLNKGFQNDQSSAPMMQTVAIDPGMQVQLPGMMRGLAYGGEVGDGETVQVGENGAELVHKAKDGSVYVLPNPKTLMHEPAQAIPEQYGLDQTVQGDDTPNLSNGENDAINRQVGLPTSADGRPERTLTNVGQTVTPSPPSANGTMMPNPQDLMGGLSPNQQKLADLYQQAAIAGQVHPNKLKDAAFGALQGFNNAINRINQPIQDYSQMKAQKRLGVLEPQLQAAQASVGLDEAASKQREDAANQASKRGLEGAQAGYYGARPGIAADNNATKLAVTKLVSQRIADNISRRADVKSGEAKPVVNTQGQLELEFLHPDSQGHRKPNELQKGADGNPIIVPGDEGVEWTNPVTNKVELIKAKQDVGYATGQERVNETNRHNTTEENQGQQRIDFEKNVMQPYRDAGLKLRQDEQTYRQSGNTKAADDANHKRIALVASIKSRQQQGQLSDADANALINELNAPLGASATATPDQ